MSEVEVLEFILSSIAKLSTPHLQVRGVSTIGEDEVVDFDFQYDSADHIVQGHTSVTYPQTNLNKFLDVAHLERYIQSPHGGAALSGCIPFLRSWVRCQVKQGSRSTAG